MKAVESEGASFSVSLPLVLRRTHVTANTKMLDETVQAYLEKRKTKFFNTHLFFF